MVCPTADIPTYGRGVWLECNGQSFSTTQFPQLYQSLGTNKVPDYRGMFLRGYGSQSYSQNNGERVGTTSTNYSSGTIGQIQGDATRVFSTLSQAYENLGGTLEEGRERIKNMQDSFSEIYYWGHHSTQNLAGYGYDDYSTITNQYSSRDTQFLEGFGQGFYTYELKYSTSTDEDGNEHIDSIELIPTWHDAYSLATREWIVYSSNEMTSPTSNEIRPVNVAVKFMIKAK